MEKKPIKEEKILPAAEKKIYTTPAVTEYGKLTELTGAGVGSKTENSAHPTGHPNKP